MSAEQAARQTTDNLVTPASWAVQDVGVALRKFPLTGTEIKPLEIVMFMRAANSRGLLEQRKGRVIRRSCISQSAHASSFDGSR